MREEVIWPYGWREKKYSAGGEEKYGFQTGTVSRPLITRRCSVSLVFENNLPFGNKVPA
jgi:hypothetical protein